MAYGLDPGKSQEIKQMVAALLTHVHVLSFMPYHCILPYSD